MSWQKYKNDQCDYMQSLVNFGSCVCALFFGPPYTKKSVSLIYLGLQKLIDTTFIEKSFFLKFKSMSDSLSWFFAVLRHNMPYTAIYFKRFSFQG